MKLKDYQESAYTFARYETNRYEENPYPYFGLMEEVGELMTYFSKRARGDSEHWDTTEWDKREELAQKEVGDVLWMLAAICTDNDWSMEDIATENIKKLTDRKVRDCLKGDGDER